MTADGAHQGIGAHAAMAAIVGGADPGEPESAGEMRDRIMAMTRERAVADYDSFATYVARVVLELLVADPSLASMPIEGWRDERDEWHPGLYGVVKERAAVEDVELMSDYGMSGFQWGWACNAARRCVELGPVPNPAIVEIGGES